MSAEDSGCFRRLVARCRFCGATRTFTGTLEDILADLDGRHGWTDAPGRRRSEVVFTCPDCQERAREIATHDRREKP